MRLKYLTVFLTVVLGSWAQEPAVVDWIRSHAVPLETVQSGHGFADMQPLKQVVGDARIVSLGEATHGAREFFQMKHRMLEFLATEMGFNIFAIEANMPEAYRLNDYVLNGIGDPKQLLRGMYFWTWNTEEVLDMILWMRQFNASGKGRLQFTGFDMQTPDVAMANAETFLASADPGYYASATQTYAEVARSRSSRGFASGDFPALVAAGRRVRFSGYIKTDGVTHGYAGLSWRLYSKTGLLAYANMSNQGARGTADWRQYEIVIDVPAEAAAIVFGVEHPGNGTAWFDSLGVEVDGYPYRNMGVADFDFESPTMRGFHQAGGDGYSVQLDNAVAQAGKQSLRSQYLGLSGDQVAGWCAAVVEHMESTRDAYLAAGFSEWDVDWAIQNARIVAQAVGVARDPNTRDPAMARNVQWILDHNAGAKIVLWAHNLHVATGGYPDYPGWFIMGEDLRKMYGSDMVVFGFAFNRGGFRAYDMVNQRLTDFEVSEAPPGTLDAVFAATGIPVFALDLRQVPETGPESWLREPHPSRTVGAGYADAYASNYFPNLTAPAAFDAMLFVENTTRARPVLP